MDPAKDYIEQLISEAIKSTKDISSALVQAYAASNTKQIDAYLPLFDQALAKLELLYSNATRPIWVPAFRQLLASWGTDETNKQNIRRVVFTQILRFHSDIEALRLENVLSSPVINFDAIVLEAVKEFKIDELYTKAIQTLSKLIESGRIDSVQVRSDLKALLDTLRAAEGATYHSKVSTIQFVNTYFKHLGNEVLKGTKYGKAFLSTMDELGGGAENAIKAVHDKLTLLAQEKAQELKHGLQLLKAPENDDEDK